MTYRDRRAARAERLRDWADSRDAKADAARAKVDGIAGMIPFGQPILVGHHSEGRHRRDLDRIHNGMGKVVEHGRMADRHRSKADNIDAAAERAIYRDDPDAVERLVAKLEDLEGQRDRIKAYNKTARAGQPDPEILDDRQRAALESQARHMPDYHARKKGQMPGYVLSNLSGTITKERRRLAELTKENPTP